jgi:hypothetical protein
MDYRDAVEPEATEVDALWKAVADPDAEFRILRPSAPPPVRRREARWAWVGGLSALAAAVLVAWWIGSSGQEATPKGSQAPTAAPYGTVPSEHPNRIAPNPPSPAGSDAAGGREEPSEDLEVVAPHPERVRTPKRSSATKPSKLEQLARETAMIRSAEASLRKDDPAAALDVLREHALAFPKGALTIERKALRVIALCRGGHAIQGRGEAALLDRHEASTPYRERMRRACKGE